VRQSRWAALLLGALLAACTGGYGTKSVPDSIDRTLAALPRLTTTSTETHSYRTPLDVRAVAGYDAASGRYRLVVRFPKQPPPGDPGATSIELPRRYDLVVAGDQVYLRSPSLAGRFGTQKAWLRTSSADAGPLAAQLLLSRWAPYDPVAILQLVRGIRGDLTTVGEQQTVDGVATTHYRATVQTAAAVSEAPAAARSRIAATADALAARFGASSFPADLWVDGDALIRRVRFGLRVADATRGGPPIDVTVTVDLAAADHEVTVEVPPANQVAGVTNARG
jgi:hypothetical protein